MIGVVEDDKLLTFDLLELSATTYPSIYWLSVYVIEIYIGGTMSTRDKNPFVELTKYS